MTMTNIMSVPDTAPVMTGTEFIEANSVQGLTESFAEVLTQTMGVATPQAAEPEGISAADMLAGLETLAAELVMQTEADGTDVSAVLERLSQLIEEMQGDDKQDYYAAMSFLADILSSILGASGALETTSPKPGVEAALAALGQYDTDSGENSANTFVGGESRREEQTEVKASPEPVRAAEQPTDLTDTISDMIAAISVENTAVAAPETYVENAAGAYRRVYKAVGEVSSERTLMADEIDFSVERPRSGVAPVLPAPENAVVQTAQVAEAVPQVAPLVQEVELSQEIITTEAPEILVTAGLVDSKRIVAPESEASPEVIQTAQALFEEMKGIVTEKLEAEAPAPVAETPEPVELFTQTRRHSLKITEAPDEMRQLLESFGAVAESEPEIVTAAAEPVKFTEADSGGRDVTETSTAMPDLAQALNPAAPAQFTQNAQTAPQPTPQPLAQQVAGQIITTLGDTAVLQSGAAEFEMVLNPESLGKITVKLTSDGGEVAVEILAESAETARLLSGRAEALQLTLRESGVTLSAFSVSEPEQAYPEQERQQQEQHEQQEQRNAPEEDYAESEISFSELLYSL